MMNEEVKLESEVTVTRKKPGRKPVELKATPVEVPYAAKPEYIDPTVLLKRKIKEKWMADRLEKSQLVTGKFLFNECHGGELKFPFREFPGDEIIIYTLRHDQIHTIPLGLAMHLNDRCSYPEYQHNLDKNTIEATNMYVTTLVHRTNFIPLDWSKSVGNSSGKSIVQVTTSNPLSNNQMLDSMGR